jgi:hypothetical protein
MSAKSSVLSSTSTLNLPLPDLENPRGFDEWYRTMESAGFIVDELASSLLTLNSPLASVRAARLIISQGERARMICSFGLASTQRDVYLFALGTLAAIDINLAHQNNDHPELQVQAARNVLETIIFEIEAIGGSLLMQEVLTRALVSMTGVFHLVDDFDKSEQYAAKAEMIGKAIGLYSVAMIARFQLATQAAYKGQINQAKTIFEFVAENANSPKQLIRKAHNSTAKSLLLLGDEDALEAYLKVQPVENSQQLKIQTLRDDIDSVSMDTNNGFREQTRFWSLVAQAQNHFGTSAEEFYQVAFTYVHALLGTVKGFERSEVQAMIAFLQLRSHELKSAIQTVPSLESLIDMPAATQLFCLSVRIEALSHHASEKGQDLILCIQAASKLFEGLHLNIARQIAEKLAILTPHALVLITRTPKIPANVKTIGDHCIFQFTRKTIEVYGRTGLRPVHAISLMLEEFGFAMETFADGGGQRRGLSEALFFSYHRRQIWHKPVSALFICTVLMKLPRTGDISVTHFYIANVIQDLIKRFGLLPKIQKIEMDKWISKIADGVNRDLDLLIENSQF